MQKNIAGLKRYIANERAEAEKVIESFRKDVADTETALLWSIRRMDRVIHAAVLLQRMNSLEHEITRYKNVIEHKVDPGPLTQDCGGEITEQTFCDYLVNSLIKRLAERARHLNSGLESQEERNADVEIMARIIDEGQYRWYAQEEVTAS